jgi:signal transduction histidine kinase
MVHDIKSPLQNMVSSLDFMREYDVIMNDPDILDMIDVCGYCSEFILSQVNNFLDLSKTEIAKIDLNPTPTELIELIKKIV